MKQILIIVVALGIVVALYFHFHPRKVEAKAEPHLAPPGIFYLLEYASVPTASGVIGFEPGSQVHFVRSDRARGMLVVTDGSHEVEVPPALLTNDLDMAALARHNDEASQHQLNAFADQQRAAYAAMLRATQIRDGEEMDRAINRMHTPQNGVPPPPTPPPSTNPYSYLSR